MINCELLAPAGSFESLKAAVLSGTDAVYLGGSLFNARASATNFNDEELEEAVDFCHLHKVKVYVTVNILISDKCPNCWHLINTETLRWHRAPRSRQETPPAESASVG